MASTNEKEKAFDWEDGRAVKDEPEEQQVQQVADEESKLEDDAHDQQHRRHPQEHPRAFQGGWQGFTLQPKSSNEKDPEASELASKDDANSKTLTENDEEQQKSDHDHAGGEPTQNQLQQQLSPANWISSWEHHFPRSYHLVVFIVAPLLMLIALAFLCGHFVAMLESPHEKQANDGAMAEIVLKFARLDRLRLAAQDSPRLCLESYVPSTTADGDDDDDDDATNSSSYATRVPFNRTELAEHMATCGARHAEEVQGIVDAFLAEWGVGVYDSLTFDWNVCGPPNRTKIFDRVKQTRFFVDRWFANFEQLLEATYGNTDNNSTDQNSTIADFTPEEVALFDQVVASDQCELSTPAGALFWFTVMTTIVSTHNAVDRQAVRSNALKTGSFSHHYAHASSQQHCLWTQGYGNATLQTSGGRFLVYTLGFLSILVFTATIGRAGYVLLVVADDLFHRLGWPRLTRGITAVLLWAAVFVLWVVVIAGVAMAWSSNRYELSGLNLRDAMWFAYISVTTIGFGA